MRHFIRLVESTFGPIRCSDSCGENMAGMAVEPLTESVMDLDQSDVTDCGEFTFHHSSIYNIIFNKYP